MNEQIQTPPERSDSVQAAVCLRCGTGWRMPDDLPASFESHCPLPRGLWELPCPSCGGAIWVSGEVERAVFDPD